MLPDEFFILAAGHLLQDSPQQHVVRTYDHGDAVAEFLNGLSLPNARSRAREIRPRFLQDFRALEEHRLFRR